MARLLPALLLLASRAHGHTILHNPLPRTSFAPGNVTKLQPFESAFVVADGGCGGITNGDSGMTAPNQVYSPGQSILVSWTNTIAHTVDRLDGGVRVAVCYDVNDCFNCNVRPSASGHPLALPVARAMRPTLPLPAKPPHGPA